MRNEIASADPSLSAANTKINTLTKITPKYGTLCRFVFANILGIIFIFAIPWQIPDSPLTVEFCVLTTASAETRVIQIRPADPRRFSP